MKLSVEEKEDLQLLVSSSSWEALMKVISTLVKDFDNRVLSFTLSDGADKLVIEKARSEGANRLFRHIIEFEAKIKAERD